MSWQEEDMIAEQTPSKEKVYSGMQKNVPAAAMRIGRTKPVYVNYTKEGRLRNERKNV
ncbi:unknown [Clostridium sp. CAG:510]|nr:unknown [Clostridium sp. CAG:510]